MCDSVESTAVAQRFRDRVAFCRAVQACPFSPYHQGLVWDWCWRLVLVCACFGCLNSDPWDLTSPHSTAGHGMLCIAAVAAYLGITMGLSICVLALPVLGITLQPLPEI